jgi:rhamnosyltransferase
MKCFDDRSELGIKTCFSSDSFAAYRKSALDSIGSFPKKLSLGEDVFVAAKMLIHGYHVGYIADAAVFHSHELTLKQESQRYYAIGAFHGQEEWILKTFGTANNEGFAFIRSELAHLCKHKQFHWIPRAMLSTVVKYISYRLGFTFGFRQLP